MLFNSLAFLIFLPIVFVLYWAIFSKSINLRNGFIFVVSYIFYGWWDWRFLLLILFSSIVDFAVGNAMAGTANLKHKKWLLFTSLFINLGLLGFFKYYNFFIDNFAQLISSLGFQPNVSSLNIILPVGISFYTFQTLSYSIDIYRGQIKPTKNILAFLSFVSFFPQLVAGPIERAANLLPQFFKRHSFNYNDAILGLRQILWGFFKKVVIADNCAEFVNIIFNNPSDFDSLTLLAGAILFSFQIYGDFSGYSDIAIGVSRLLGFNLMQNFAYPYFSRDVAEFWRRWHISLSTWFRDYVYIPLGGSKGKLISQIQNVFVIFLISGFWHGANWTFIIWGALNAIYFLPIFLLKKNRHNLNIVAENRLFPEVKEIFSMGKTFLLISISWIFFRSENVSASFSYIKKLFSVQFELPSGADFAQTTIHPFVLGGLLLVFICIKWLGRSTHFAIEKIEVILNKQSRLLFYYVLIFILFAFKGGQQAFIYFQF